ncbi:LysR family transcriptional regulator [Kitasatospora sp. McL0602]|uniref:LysR family transcriptional regulator n=1 Tax=Kitasatospora sp. McL0602 TaxID=3439530 RepID=UPI003F8C3E99
MDIDARTLRTFCAVIQTGSFTKAAHRLGYSQSSVTSQMRALERELGQQIFQRLPTGVRLTAAGATLRGYSRQLLTLVNELEEAMRGPSATTPRLTIGIAPALGYGEQLARLAHFGRRLLPDVQLALRVLGTAELHAALRGAELDGALLLAGAESPGRRSTASVRTAMLAERARTGRPNTGDRRELDDLLETAVHELEFAPVAGIPQCAATPETLRPDALRPGAPRPDTLSPGPLRHVVTADPDCPSQRWLPEFLRLRNGETPEVLELGSVDGVDATVQSGLGCAMVPSELLSTHPDTPLLPLPGVPRMHWTVALLTVRSRDISDTHRRALTEAVRQALTPPCAHRRVPATSGVA